MNFEIDFVSHDFDENHKSEQIFLMSTNEIINILVKLLALLIAILF